MAGSDHNDRAMGFDDSFENSLWNNIGVCGFDNWPNIVFC